MTLQFNPGDYYQAWQRGQQTQQQNAFGPLESANQLGQTLGGIGQQQEQYQRQKQQDAINALLNELRQKQENRTQGEFDYKYGQPIDPNQMVGNPTSILGKSSFMPGGQGQVATPSPLIESFNQWRASGMKGTEAKPEYMPALGQEERKAYYTQMNPKPAAGMTTANLSWETATPTQQNMAKSMVKGDVLPSDLGMRDRATVVGLANEYALKNNIPFQSYQGNVRKGMAENLAYGKMGQNALSLNTALGHAADALKSYEDIANTNQAFLNKPINWIKRNTNDPRIIALGLNLNALHGELANVFKGSGGTDQEIGSWVQYLNENLTPIQAREAIIKVDALLRSRTGALEYQQKNVMQQPVTERKLLSPHAAELSNQFQSLGNNNQHPQDSEAVQWAKQKQNMNDPRARRILQLNGAQ